MGIALSIQQYLDGQSVSYDALKHRPTGCAVRSASVSHVPVDKVAKAVVLSSRSGYVLAVVPASRRVNLDGVGHCLEQPVALATEDELTPLFPDCQRGAVPPIGAAYGLRTVIDDSLATIDDIYFEAGDHRTLVHVAGRDFYRLMRTFSHGRISLPETRNGGSDGYCGA